MAARDILAVEIQGDVEQYLENLGIAVDKQQVKALLDAALHAEGEIKQAISELFASGGTGELARNPKATLLEVEGAIKSSGAFLDLVYADIQDRGGTIYPKNVKNLAIPLSATAKVPGKWPRTWPRGPDKPKVKDFVRGTLFFHKSKKGNKLLVEKTRTGTVGPRGGRKIEITPHYVLKPEVTIKGKGYLKRAADRAAAGIVEILGEHVRIAIDHTEMPT